MKKPLPERQDGSPEDLAAAQKAVDAVAQLIDRLLQLNAQKDRVSVVQLLGRVSDRETTIRAQLDFDADGIAGFQFYELRHGEGPELVIDVLPKRNLNS